MTNKFNMLATGQYLDMVEVGGSSPLSPTNTFRVFSKHHLQEKLQSILHGLLRGNNPDLTDGSCYG